MPYLARDLLERVDKSRYMADSARLIEDFEQRHAPVEAPRPQPLDPNPEAQADLVRAPRAAEVATAQPPASSFLPSFEELQAGQGQSAPDEIQHDPAQSSTIPQNPASQPASFLPSLDDLIGGVRETVQRGARAVGLGGDEAQDTPSVAPRPAQAPSGTPSAMPSGQPTDARTYVRQAAAARGLDPDEVERVMLREGGAGWDAVGRFDTGNSYGPLQLHVGGEVPGGAAGMGDDFLRETGRHPKDDPTGAVDYALDRLARTGDWREWYGADVAFANEGGRFKPVSRIAPTETGGGGATLPAPNARQAPGAAPPASGAAPSADVDQAALDDPDKWALCGPVAAVIAAQARGQNWTVADAKRIAQAGGLWDADTGMHGLATQVQMLNRMGIGATTGQADRATLAADAQAGNTPIVSTNKHYFILKGYDPSTGKFDTSTSGAVLKGGSRWLTLEEIERLGGGIQGAAYLDNPTSPTPSVAAGDYQSLKADTGDAEVFAPPGMDEGIIPQPTGISDYSLNSDQGDGGPMIPARTLPPVRDDYARATPLQGPVRTPEVDQALAAPEAAPPSYIQQTIDYLSSFLPSGNADASTAAPTIDGTALAPPGSPYQPEQEAAMGAPKSPMIAGALETPGEPDSLPASYPVTPGVVDAARSAALTVARPVAEAIDDVREFTGAGDAQRRMGRLPELMAKPPEELTDEERDELDRTMLDVGQSVSPVGFAGTVGRAGRGAARGVRAAMAEGQQAIRMTPEQEVGRLRLDKFPEEVRDLIQQSAEGVDYARAQRRGVLPDEVVQRMADEDQRSVDQLIKQGKAGRAYNPEETVAIRNAVASQANEIRNLSEQIAEQRAAGNDPVLLIARRNAEATRLNGLVQLAEGARAEAGRTLRQYRQQARLIELNPEDAIARIRKRIGDPDEFNKIVDDYTRIVQEGSDPIQMAKLWAKVENGEITKSDLFNLYRRFNMLSGPRTLEVNALSGGVNLGYEVATQAAGQLARGRVNEMAAEFAAPFKAASRAFEAFTQTLRHGVTEAQAARGDIPRSLSMRTDNPLAKGALQVMEAPDRFNAATDQFFRTMTEDWAATILAHRQARAAGLTPRSRGWADAVADNLAKIREDTTKFPEIKEMADHVGFSEEPGPIGKGLEDLRRRAPAIVSFVFPFIRTPYNIASRAVDISPLGIPRTAVEATFNVGRGRENLSRRVRDNTIGTAMAVWAYSQAMQGTITGMGPDDAEKRAQLRATGWQPFSVRIGDQYWSYSNFAPFSLALSSGAAAAEAQRYAKKGETDSLSLLGDAAKRTATVVTDMSVLAGIGSLVNSIRDPERYGTQWLTTQLSTLIPAGSALNTVGQMTDPTIRRAERESAPAQIAQNLEARVPVLRQSVPAAQDPLGRDVPNDVTGTGALNPFRPTRERPDPVIQAFLDAGVDIGKPREDLSLRGGAKISLTPAEQRRWNTLRGEALQRIVPDVIRSADYRTAPAVAREKTLRTVLDRAAEEATGKMLSGLREAEIRRRMAAQP